MGTRVETPELNMAIVKVPSDLNILKNWIDEKENALGNVRPGNASRIIFNDSLPQKTKYSVLYLHGFTASGMEGDPVHRDIAKALNANLFMYDIVELGVGYRLDAAMTAMVNFRVSPICRIGYSYDSVQSELNFIAKSSHEVFINFDLNFNTKVSKSPRYF